MTATIESYGLIGDCQTAALVGLDGSIDWLCWPRFDSDACFAALLGKPSHGRWLLTTSDEIIEVSRRYRPDTLVLETTFRTATGTATLIDFMLPRGRTSDLIRLVRGDEGEVAMCMELVLRFGYGATIPWVSRLEDGTMRAVAGPDMAVLRTPVTLWGENFMTRAMFTIAKGKTMPFVLSYGPSHLPVPEPVDPEAALAACVSFWTEWTGATKTDGPHADAIKRSLITLKALTYAPSGGIVAAPTTSLPEQAGGPRNWDYRYCWIRDSTLTLLALMNAGVYDEATAWRDWLQRAVAGDPADMQIMYGIMGERRLTEWEVKWLPGYLEFEAGADRQRRLQPVPARRLRRADGHLRAGAQGSAGAARERLGPAGRADEACRRVLVPARLRHLGDARSAAPLRLFQGDGLGGLRPRHQGDRALRAARPGR